MASPEEMLASMIANFPEKTGKTLAEWHELVKKTGFAKHGEIVKHLKAGHALGHGYANLVAHTALAADKAPAGEDELVAAQYSGKKEGLRPIYDALVKAVAAFGKDVEIAPKKAYVSLRRKKQFGLIQPSTATRVDVGLNLGATKPTGRLEASGSFNAMVSHRVRLEAKGQVDKELIGWLRQAYDAS